MKTILVVDDDYDLLSVITAFLESEGFLVVGANNGKAGLNLLKSRRPDLVLYVNGIAIGVLELKNSRKSVGGGIRQNLSNQQPEFNEWFFSTVQLVMAGNDSEGLRYGTIRTEEKYFLKWKEDEQENSGYKLDKYVVKICR